MKSAQKIKSGKRRSVVKTKVGESKKFKTVRNKKTGTTKRVTPKMGSKKRTVTKTKKR